MEILRREKLENKLFHQMEVALYMSQNYVRNFRDKSVTLSNHYYWYLDF